MIAFVVSRRPNDKLFNKCCYPSRAVIASSSLTDAVRRMRTRIRLLAQPESMRSIIDATQREQRHGLAWGLSVGRDVQPNKTPAQWIHHSNTKGPWSETRGTGIGGPGPWSWGSIAWVGHSNPTLPVIVRTFTVTHWSHTLWQKGYI